MDVTDFDDAKKYIYEAKIELPKPEYARMVATALNVDDELRPTLVTKRIAVVGSTVVFVFSAVDARTLRTSVLSILDFTKVSLSAIAAFAT